MLKILEEEYDNWIESNAVWNPQVSEPSHINCMKKAEVTNNDGK